MTKIKLPVRTRLTTAMMEPDEREERKDALNEYLNLIIKSSAVNRSFLLLHFLKLENPKRSPVVLPVTRQGIMVKRGDHVDELRARYFVLADNLYYFKDKLDVVPVGIIPLQNGKAPVTIEEDETHIAKEKEFAFTIFQKTENVSWHVKVESKKSRKEWIAMIREAAVSDPKKVVPVPKMDYAVHAGVGADLDDAEEEQHPELEETVVNAYRAIFKELDQDNSGAISVNELIIALSDAGWEFKDDVAAHLMEMVDYDISGALDVDEFIDLISMLNFLQSAFEVIDQDRRGQISRAELPEALKSAEFSFETEQQVEALFALCDPKESGFVEFEDYLHLIFFLKYLTKMFRDFDPESSGELDKSELPALLEKGAWDVAPEAHLKIMDIVDRTHTSSLSFEEVVHYVFVYKFAGIEDQIQDQMRQKLDKQVHQTEVLVKKRRDTIHRVKEEKAAAAKKAAEKQVDHAAERIAQRAHVITTLQEPGMIILKQGKKGKPDKVKLFVSHTGDKVHWKDRKTFIVTADITDVIAGRTTDVFKKHSAPAKENISLSLVTKERTLDLECASPEERDRLVQEFKLIVEKEPAPEVAGSSAAPVQATPVLTPAALKIADLSSADGSRVRETFKQFAGSSGRAPVKELSAMLGMFSEGRFVFSEDTCADLLHAVDLSDKEGAEIAVVGFEQLVQYLNLWFAAFDKHDKFKSSALPAIADVQAALKDVNLEFEPHQVEALMMKVTASGRTAKRQEEGGGGICDFEDLASVAGHLMFIWNHFSKQAKDGAIGRAAFRALLPELGIEVAEPVIKIVTNDLIHHGEDQLTFDNVAELAFTIQFVSQA